MKTESALAEFLTACRADGLADKTLKFYTSTLTPMAQEFFGRDIREVTTKDIREYIVSLSERDTRHGKQRPIQAGPLSDETIKSHKRAILRFWKWVSDEYEIPDPAARIKHPGKSKGKSTAAITQENVLELIKTAASGGMHVDEVNKFRDTAMVLMLADSTVRASGLLSIRTQHIDLRDRTAIVTEKGDKMRKIHFTEITAYAISQWLAVRPDDESGMLFLSLSKNGQSKGALKYAGLYQMLKRLAIRAGITGKFNPHAFRHSFAKEFLKSGGDLASLSQLMGHTSVVITADQYSQFGLDELSSIHDKHSPINNRPT